LLKVPFRLLRFLPVVFIHPMQFLRYSAVGLCATLAHYAVLMALVESQTCSPAWASAWGAVLGAQVAYFGNRWWTNSTTWRGATWLRFQLTAWVAALFGVLWLTLGMHLGLYYLLAQAVATLINLVLTFLVNRRWVFLRG
jgi:putative flippase GtrA